MAKSPAWQRKEGKDPKGGLNAKGRASAKAQGMNLKPPAPNPKTEKDAKRIFPKGIWNDLHLQMIWYGREYSPARAWDLEKDIITKTIGRKSILEEYKTKTSR